MSYKNTGLWRMGRKGRETKGTEKEGRLLDRNLAVFNAMVFKTKVE